MGLDMYLRAIKYDDSFKKGTIEEIGYWRKANQIHNWFVTHVQGDVDNCAMYFVSEGHLELLLEAVRYVLLFKDDMDKLIKVGEEVLPPCDGFFFGSTKIDEDYVETLEETVSILERGLDLYRSDDFVSIYYRSSW